MDASTSPGFSRDNGHTLQMIHLKSIIRFRLIMVRSNTIAVCIFSLLPILTSLVGCATHDRPSSEVGETPAILMKGAADDLDKGRYEEAIRKFEKIVKEHPQSESADEAMLKMADAYYKRKDHYMAFTVYWMFEMRHPRHADLPYAIFRQAMCLFNEVRGFDTNQSMILEARGEFERLNKEYPSSEFAELARQKIRECDELIARYELHVGHFYFSRKKYRAALGRYEYVMKNYPALDSYQEAFEYAKKSRVILHLPEIQETPEPSPPTRETLMIAVAARSSDESRPPRRQTVVALQNKEEIKPERPMESRPPTPVVTNASPRIEEKSELTAPVEEIQTTPPKPAFSVQVGAFLVKKNAERLVAGLTDKGYRPFMLELPGYGKRCWYSVRILNCHDVNEAFHAASEYRAKEGMPAIVTGVDSLDPILSGS